MPARIRSFEDPDPLEVPIYIDTSILIHLLGPTARWIRDAPKRKAALADAFLDRCAKEDAVVAISLHTYIELRSWVFVGMYKDLADREGYPHYKAAYSRQPEYMGEVTRETERVELLLAAIPSLVTIETPISIEILTRSYGFMFQLNLEPADAIHYAIASLEGISAYATVDEAWYHIPGIHLYTSSERLLNL